MTTEKQSSSSFVPPVRNEPMPVTGIEVPEHMPQYHRFFGKNALPTRSWAPESAGFLGLGDRARALATTSPTMLGGLTPAGYMAIQGAKGEDASFGDYVSNWWAGWADKDNGPSMFDFTGGEAFTPVAGPREYLDVLYGEDTASPDSRFALFTKEMQDQILDSEFKEQLEFKLRLHGETLHATQILENYDKESNWLTYGTAKTTSALLNYVGQDLVGNLATMGASGFLAKGAMGAKNGLRAVGFMGGEATLGAAFGAAYEDQRVMIQSKGLGVNDAEFQSSSILYGSALGLLAGSAGWWFTRNIANERAAAALIDEMSGQPVSRLRVFDDMVSPEGIKENMNRSDLMGRRVDTLARETKVGRSRLNWIYNEQALSHSPFKSPEEALEWVETAKPSKAELDKMDHYFATKLFDDAEGERLVYMGPEEGHVPLKDLVVDSPDGAARPVARAADDVADDVDGPRVYDPADGVPTIRQQADEGLDNADGPTMVDFDEGEPTSVSNFFDDATEEFVEELDEVGDGSRFFDPDSGGAAPVRSYFDEADEVADGAGDAFDDLDEAFDELNEVIEEAVRPELDVFVETEFQRTGVVPAPVTPEPAATVTISPAAAASDGQQASVEGGFEASLDRLDDGMQLATAVGILNGFSRRVGLGFMNDLIGSVGTWGTRGAGYRNAVKSVANLFQHIAYNGVRNTDQTVQRSATLSMDGARRQAERFLAADIGIQKVLNKNATEIRKAINSGDNVLSEIVAGGGRYGDWGKELAQKFDEAFDKMGERAARAGLIEKKTDYFPVLFNRGAVQTNGDEFVEAFSNYLTKHFDETGELSLITAKRLGWVQGPAGDLRVTDKGRIAGLTDDMTLTSLNDEAKSLYQAELPQSIRDQAKRAEEAFHGNQFESLLTNPDALEEGAMYVKGFFNTNSKKRQTLNKDIYLDEGMKPFMEQNIETVYSHAIRNLGADTEFALSQLAVHGEALTFDAVVDRTRKYIAKSGSPAAEKKKMLDLVKKAERAYQASMGRLEDVPNAFGNKVTLGIVELAQSVTRLPMGMFWGIPVLSMEVPRTIMARPTQAGSYLGNFLKGIARSQHRWEVMGALGEALEQTTLQMRGHLEMTGHEGIYMGRTVAERFKAPWINIKRNFMTNVSNGRHLDALGRGVIDLADGAATLFTQIGLMPLLTSSGRVATGLLTESILLKMVNSRKGNRLRLMAEAIKKQGGRVTPQEFKTLARQTAGLDAMDATLYNRAGLLSDDVLDFMDAASKAGQLNGKRIDPAALYRWSLDNGFEEGYKRFSGGMTELVSERMNFMFATPNAASRIDVNPNNPFSLMSTMFFNFPASFYQQNLQMVAADPTLRGTALYTTYVALEALHRGVRDIVQPNLVAAAAGKGQKDSFMNPDAVFEDWAENPYSKLLSTWLNGTPTVGMYPAGQAIHVLTGKSQDLNLSIIESSVSRLLREAGQGLRPDEINGPQIAGEYSQLFNIYNALESK